MKKTLFVLGLAFGLGMSTWSFAGGIDMATHNSRSALTRIGSGSGMNMPADTSSQNSRKALTYLKCEPSTTAGSTTFVYSSKGGAVHAATVAVVR